MSAIRGVNVGGNLFDVTDSSNVAPIELTNFATRNYAKDRCFIMIDGLLYRAMVAISSGDPIVINGNAKRTTLDEMFSVVETDSDLIAPTEDGATSSDDYVIGEQIVRSGILYKVIDDIAEGDAFVVGNNIELAGTITSQIQTLTNLTADKAEKDDLTSIYITGTINNTGSTIYKRTYFYINNILAQAREDILNGSALTEGTNYNVITAGALNVLDEELRTRYVTLLNNTTASKYEAADVLASGLFNYKYVAITYLYGLTGLEYTKFLFVPSTRATRLDIVTDYSGTTYTDVIISGVGNLTVQGNGSASGVFIKTVVGIK